MKRNGAIYVRVSKEEQKENNQIDPLKTFASLQNINVAKVYIDKFQELKIVDLH